MAVHRSTVVTVLVTALLSALPGAASAQVASQSFDELRVGVDEGDTLTVTTRDGRHLKGRLTALSPTTIELLVDNQHRVVMESFVTTIRQRRHDPPWNGALYGVVAGTLPGITCAFDRDPLRDDLLGIAVCAGFGFAIGAGIDAAISGSRTVFERGTARQLTVHPLTTSRTVGAQTRMGF